MNGQQRSRQVLQRLLAAALALMLLISGIAVLPVTAATQEGDEASRLINVVYDDSVSMISWLSGSARVGSSDVWSQAKYSMMILNAMMQENDIMNIYFMSSFMDNPNARPLLANLSGKSAQKAGNMDKILNEKTDSGGTYFESIRKAYNDLKADGGSYDERHLIVITDGSGFSGDHTAEDMDQLFRNAAGDDILITYLAIGEDTMQPAANDAIVVYEADPYDTAGANAILKRTEEMAQRVFQREPIRLSGGKLKLTLPVSEIVVFAQGADVSVGNIDGTSKQEVSAALTADDRDKATINPDHPQILGLQNIIVAEGLSGTVAVFKPKNGSYIAEGDYDLNINATTYTVYYKPCLDVSLKLTDAAGNTVESGSDVNIGTYTADYFLTYPEGHAKHGEPIDNPDFNVSYTLTVTCDGRPPQTLSGNGPQQVELGEGSTVVSVEARYLTYISTDATITFSVKDLAETALKVTVTAVTPKTIQSGNFNAVTPSARVKITWMGAPLTKEQYDFLELTAAMKKEYTVTDDHGNEVPLLSVSDVTLDPYAEGEDTMATVTFLAQGDAETQRTKLGGKGAFLVSATVDHNGSPITSQGSGKLNIRRTWTAFEILLLLIILGIILFLLLGYVFCKKYLPTAITVVNNRGKSKTMNPYTRFPTLLSVLIPFRGVTTTVSFKYVLGEGDDIQSYTASLKLKASGKNSATLMNAVELYKGSVYMMGTNIRLEQMVNPKETGKGGKKRKTRRKKRPFVARLRSAQFYREGALIGRFVPPRKRRRSK